LLKSGAFLYLVCKWFEPSHKVKGKQQYTLSLSDSTKYPISALVKVVHFDKVVVEDGAASSSSEEPQQTEWVLREEAVVMRAVNADARAMKPAEQDKQKIAERKAKTERSARGVFNGEATEYVKQYPQKKGSRAQRAAQRAERGKKGGR